MFGLLRQIRDKSDSDFNAEKKITNELSDIARYDAVMMNSSVSTTVPRSTRSRLQGRLRREADLTTDSDHYSHTSQVSSDSALQPPTPPPSQDNNRSRMELAAAQRAWEVQETERKMKNHYKSKLPLYSDDDLEKAHQNRDQLIDPLDNRPIFPFSILSHQQGIRNGEVGGRKEKVRKNAKEKQFQQLVVANQDVELLDSRTDNMTVSKRPKANLKVGKNSGDAATTATPATTAAPTTTTAKTHQSRDRAPLRYKMAVFKSRIKTDKALYHSFSRKVISHRRKILSQQQEDHRLHLEQQLARYYQNKTVLLEQLDNAPLSALLQNGQQQALIQPTSGIDSCSEDLVEITEEDIVNIVTRVEMDTIVDHTALKEQEQCHYCTYRPLHTYSMHSSSSGQGIAFTGESGLQHWDIIGGKMQNELLKGGRFVNDIERVLFALKLGYPIVPLHSNYIDRCNGVVGIGENGLTSQEPEEGQAQSSSSPQSQQVRSLNTLMEIQSYARFATKQHLPTQSPFQQPLANDANNNTTKVDNNNNHNDGTDALPSSLPPPQIVIKLDTDWFGITPRNPLKSNYYAVPTNMTTTTGATTSVQNDKNTPPLPTTTYPTPTPQFYDFISTHHGVTLFCKDLYALDTITSLAAFHSCYSTVHQLGPWNGTTTTDHVLDAAAGGLHPDSDHAKYLYQVEIYFNTGCCLCSKDGELGYIRNCGGVGMGNKNDKQQQQQQQDLQQQKPKQEQSQPEQSQPEQSQPEQPQQEQNPDVNDQQQPCDSIIDLDFIDVSPSDDDDSLVVGQLTDSYGLRVEQFTYCIPHLQTVNDIDIALNHANDEDY